MHASEGRKRTMCRERDRRRRRKPPGFPHLRLMTSCLPLALLLIGAPAARAQTMELVSVRIIAETGGRVDWDPSGRERIAFDRTNRDGYYDVYTILPDGSGLVSLTDGRSGIWQRNNGNPCWHPSGDYIVFESEHPDHMNVQDSWQSDPGVGCYMELWATTPDAAGFWQLTEHPQKMRLDDHRKVKGVLNPHFTPDGSRLIWTERFDDGGKWGKWRVLAADFVIAPDTGPRLENPEVLFTPTPSMGDYVTCTDVSPDGTTLLLAGNLEGQDEFGMDLHVFDLPSSVLTDLTNDPVEWTEGSAFTRDGTGIVYMSNHGDPFDFSNPHWNWQKIRREYWIMGLDGSGKTQVTHFNTRGYPEYDLYDGRDVIVNDCSWRPDGTQLASTIGVDVSPTDQANYILKVGILTFRQVP